MSPCGQPWSPATVATVKATHHSGHGQGHTPQWCHVLSCNHTVAWWFSLLHSRLAQGRSACLSHRMLGLQAGAHNSYLLTDLGPRLVITPLSLYVLVLFIYCPGHSSNDSPLHRKILMWLSLGGKGVQKICLTAAMFLSLRFPRTARGQR